MELWHMSVRFILGGARSGKSRYAQELAASLGRRVLYVATAEALDEEMNSRIEAHKKSRPPTWKTLEAQTDVAKAISSEIGDADVVVLDCLTLLISNLRGEDSADIETWEKRMTSELETLISLMEVTPSHFIIVSNDVSLGLVPPSTLGRAYRDILGVANQMLAKHAEEVYFMIAGIPILLKGRTCSDESGLSLERGQG
jgi:adenosylcobinamide kinase/adenosylcobinamide-phosphate guanylyltransferase